MSIKKISSQQAKIIKGETDWDVVDQLTDHDIEVNANDDVDTSLPNDEELKSFKSVRSINKSSKKEY